MTLSLNGVQKWSLGSLFVGYAGYYVCRAVLAAAQPVIIQEHAAEGYDKEYLGWVVSAGTVAYMVGKLVNGRLADALGGTRLFLVGMAASALLTASLGFVGLGLLGAVWAANQFVQSAGWGGLVQTVSHRFEAATHARVMGLLSLSFLLGHALALVYFGALESAGLTYRDLFLAAGLTLLTIAAGVAWALPRHVAARPEAAATPAAADTAAVVGRLARTPAFWLVCLMSGGLTLLRTAFHFWSPTFLKEMAGLDTGQAIWGSALFPVTGAVSAVLAGTLSDRSGARRGPIVAVALVAAAAVLAAMALVPAGTHPAVSLLLVSLAAFFLTGPYTFCAGVLALDLGGRDGSATAAGLIDAAGYLASIAAGAGIGIVAERSGWPAVFQALAAVAGATAVVGVLYTLLAERR